MSDDAENGWDQDWWKKERDISHERRLAEAESVREVSPGDSFLIVTEGTVTEPVYFECFLEALELSRAKVIVIPGKKSDPKHVITTAKDTADRQITRHRKGQLGIREPAKFDHVWAVIDTDVAVCEGIWNEVQELAATKNVKLAHSTPCFEYWLLLHIGYTTRGDLVDGDAAKKAFAQTLGMDYSTNEGTARKAMAKVIDKWPRAVTFAEQARQHHLQASTPSPANPSTEVDRLVRALNDSAPKYLRQLK